MAMVICNGCGKQIHHTAAVCPRCSTAQRENTSDTIKPITSDKNASAGMKKKMYSPTQLGLGTFLGGPLAGTYFLKSNFDSLSKAIESKKTMIIGITISIVMIATLLILHEVYPNLPKISIVALYIVPVILVNKQYQLSKEAIMNSSEYSFQSNWKVLGMSIALLIAFLAIGMMVNLLLYYMGIAKLS